jgi:hypothetical protein
MRLLVAVAEDEELELGCAHRHVAGGGGALELAPEDRARCDVDEGAVGIGVDVAQHQRRAFHPGGPAQRREVDAAADVAVALLPRREAVPGHRIHVHVAREQVVAGVHPVRRDLGAEELGVVALADQPPVEIGKHHQHGVDLAAVHEVAQLGFGQHAGARRVHEARSSMNQRPNHHRAHREAQIIHSVASASVVLALANNSVGRWAAKTQRTQS